MTRKTLEQQLRELANRYGVPAESVLELGIERAAIREHLGNTPRGEAEQAAYDDVADKYKRA